MQKPVRYGLHVTTIWKQNKHVLKGVISLSKLMYICAVWNIFYLLIPVCPTVSLKCIGNKKNMWKLHENSPKYLEKYIRKCSLGSWVLVTQIFQLYLPTKLNYFNQFQAISTSQTTQL